MSNVYAKLKGFFELKEKLEYIQADIKALRDDEKELKKSIEKLEISLKKELDDDKSITALVE